MTQTPHRPDVDIVEDIQAIIATYPPLAADRHYLRVTVKDGVVALEGHVRTPINRLYLYERAAAVPGVIGLTADSLYDDESIRLAAGALLPYGVLANPKYGVLILSGAKVGELSGDVLAQTSQVPGVVRVVTDAQGPMPG